MIAVLADTLAVTQLVVTKLKKVMPCISVTIVLQQKNLCLSKYSGYLYVTRFAKRGLIRAIINI